MREKIGIGQDIRGRIFRGLGAMLVLADGNPVRHVRRPIVNYTLIALCVVIFLVNPPYTEYGFVPAKLFLVADGAGEPFVLPRLVTYIFLHGDIFHLLGNMLVLWVFGDNVEDSMGHLRYVAFFIVCGIAGALMEGAFTNEPEIIVIGASGSIAGVMGAYLLLHPRARVLVLIAFRFPMIIPASLFVGLSIATDVVMALLGDGEAAIAWWAHIGGFAAGIALLPLIRYADVPLFQPAAAYPENSFAPFNRFIVDLGHRRDAGTAPASFSERLAFGVKTFAFFSIIVLVVELIFA
ncbi:MAG: rhomboid family intramembrane serine protease [Salinarimonadaceae bacterium]|nr:MAG: rhomboid family intramembrane serine protease [Salinarimonadaceae bacterium]